MPQPLSGPIGKWIKSRLESAAIQCTPTCWEDLSLYLGGGEGWTWDRQIILQWREDICAQFLQCCKDIDEKEDVIDKYRVALDDGLEEIDGGEAADELGVESEGDCTLRGINSIPPKAHPQEDNRPNRVIFLGISEDTDMDGLVVSYTDMLLSRISRDVVNRWGIEEKIYTTTVEGDGSESATRQIEAINLTWVLSEKTYSTTFEVVADDQMDAQFGNNRFHPPLKKKRKGHSISQSLPGPARSHHSSHHSKHRRRTEPSSEIAPSKDEFVYEVVSVHMAKGLAALAEKEWEKKYGQRHSLSSSADDEDDSSEESRKLSSRTSNTSVSKQSYRKSHTKRGHQR